MASKFVIQVVEKDGGKVVQWAPGFPVERQLTEDLCQKVTASLCNRLAARGVGFFKTQAAVIAAVNDELPEVVRETLKALLYALKSDVTPSR